MNENTATQKLEGIKEIDALWVTAGLRCDGETISITKATQPSVIEGTIPKEKNKKEEYRAGFGNSCPS